MVVDGSAGNAVDLVSLDTSMSVPICLKNLTDAAQLYGGCLTSLSGGKEKLKSFVDKPNHSFQ